MTERELGTVEELAKYMVQVHEFRAKMRAKDPRANIGVAPEYLPSLIGFVYSEFLEAYMTPLYMPNETYAPDWAEPEQLILESLFHLFLNYLDEGDVRKLFAQFGPKPPRLEGAHRERALLQLYFRQHMPPKAQFARNVADYNKTVSREQRLGSRSTSEVNMLKYVERMLNNRREEVKLREKGKANIPGELRLAARERPIGPLEMPFSKDGRIAWGHFRRKMSRQT